MVAFTRILQLVQYDSTRFQKNTAHQHNNFRSRVLSYRISRFLLELRYHASIISAKSLDRVEITPRSPQLVKYNTNEVGFQFFSIAEALNIDLLD